MTEPVIQAFIPAYRCEQQIGRVIRQFASERVHRWFEEILVIDNRSPDRTVEAAIAAAAELGLGKIRIVRNQENYGLGGSHKAAFEHALRQGYTHSVTLHGDDQGSIADLLPILESGEFLKQDCCLGARFHPESRLAGYSWVRTNGNRIFNLLFSIGSGRRLYDLGSGLNLYRMEALRSRYWMGFHDNLMFNYCMVLAHVFRKDAISFIPISWREDDQLSNVKLASQAMRTLGVLGRYIRDPNSFMMHDFREIARSEYSFDDIHVCL